MLIKISEVCKAACTHCLEDATPRGEHMSFQKFIETVQFSLSLGDRDLLISGGEPSENPMFFEFLNYIEANRALFKNVFILSHGGWLDSNHDNFEIIKKHQTFFFQITNDDVFYPKPLTAETKKLLREHKNVMFTSSLSDIGSWLYPQGRATKLDVTVQTTRFSAPKSFNFRSMIVNSNMPFDEAVRTMRENNKMCSPSINVDGSISMGESRLCQHIGFVSDSVETLTRSVRSSQCNNCGMVDKLSDQYKKVIGYNRII